MRLTPADIHNTEFGKASLGRRGYDEDDVDMLLDDVTHEMIRLLEENEALRSNIGAAQPMETAIIPLGPTAAELSAATAELHRAQQACDRARRNAGLTRRQLDEAHRSAATPKPVRDEVPMGPVLATVQRTADTYVREAQEKSRQLLDEAHERAGRTLDDARRTVDAIDQKSHRHQDESAADLAAGQADAVRDIDELTRFAADYHAALERHLHRQGQLINGTSGPAGE
ncbi:DivIVA domain-containing protein [Paractinoplanes maris]|uniref:DivIVA domain-containing protein n=1 Tax=Paractinoplanes maris TaxID=1734446 RepID=UPI0020227C88|nr:DivIVA domain-containing protein [Actinoplanes maris]